MSEVSDTRPRAPKLSELELLKFLGQGAVGKVYLVRDSITKKLYAMKVYNKEHIIMKSKVQKVLNEQYILSNVNHPLIVRLDFSFQTKSNLFLFLEYCPGDTLFTVVKRLKSRTFSEPMVRFLAAEVILALEYLHMNGFIYRDLKPENILVGEDGHLRLADFDLSQLVKEESTARVVAKKWQYKVEVVAADPMRQNRFNTFAGTAEYVAPEVVSGSGHNSMVDWWSLGVLMFELAFGRTPFRGFDQDRTFAKIEQAQFSIPTDRDSSPALKSLLNSLLTRDPEKRLGFRRGAAEIKEHPFFRDYSWPMIRNEVSPLRMKEKFVPNDISADSNIRIDETVMSEPVVDDTDIDATEFAGWEYVRPHPEVNYDRTDGSSGARGLVSECSQCRATEGEKGKCDRCKKEKKPFSWHNDPSRRAVFHQMKYEKWLPDDVSIEPSF